MARGFQLNLNEQKDIQRFHKKDLYLCEIAKK